MGNKSDALVEIKSLEGFRINLPKFPKWWQIVIVLVVGIIFLLLYNLTFNPVLAKEVLKYIASIRAG